MAPRRAGFRVVGRNGQEGNPLAGMLHRKLPSRRLGTAVCVTALLALWAWFSPARVAVAAAASDYGCTASGCHDKTDPVKVEFDRGIHGAGGVLCHECHGGDPAGADYESAKGSEDAPRSGFTNLKDRLRVPEMCAHCHSDPKRMIPLGLHTDQLDHYKTSKHGERLFGQKDTRVAICTDCHGAHGIQKSSEATSATNPQQVPDTCGRCHGDADLMGQYDLLADVVAAYKTSVHAAALYQKHDLSAPTCATCHGNHGATPPGAIGAGDVCGNCHVNQREYFNASPHLAPAKEGMFKECVSCHDHHAIKRPTHSLFDTACIECHTKAGPEITRGMAVKDAIAAAETRYLSAKKRVDRATRDGVPTDDETVALADATTAITQVLPVQHALQLGSVEEFARKVRQVSASAEDSIMKKYAARRFRKLALVPIWAFLAWLSVLLWRKRRQLMIRDGLMGKH